MRKTFLATLWTLLTVVIFAWLSLPVAFAQTPPQKLAEIEKQIQALQKTAEDLRRNSPTNDVPPPENDSSTNRFASPRTGRRTNDLIARIREEGLEHSKVMETLSYLTDVIGPRLTGSPNLKRANEWTRDKLAGWGLTNTHLEAWGPFGRGWSLKRFSAQIVEPQAIPLVGYPKAWSPGFKQPLVAPVVYLDAKTDADLQKYKGKVKGAIVLSSPIREVKARFEPLATRMVGTNLLRLANAGEPPVLTRQFSAAGGTNRGRFAGGLGRRESIPGSLGEENTTSTNGLPSGAAPDNRTGPRAGPPAQPRFLSFLAKEKAALVVGPSAQGDGGIFFVSQALVPGFDGRGTNAPTNGPRVWSTNVPAIPPQVTLATEDYNRLVRMIRQGENLKMAVDLQVQFHKDDLMAYNTIAEIPGSDLKDQIVMLGAHMDSWHSGTGATDNGAGVAATMEAVRILTALKLQPRRTIRIALWSGEEQGLMGSRAYVSNHFGFYTNLTNAFLTNVLAGSASSALPSDRRGIKGDVPGPFGSEIIGQDNGGKERRIAGEASTNSPRRTLVRQAEYDEISAYFNLDNGTGKIRGVYMQGNEAVRPLFRRWLQPFTDLEAETLSLANTGGTDHNSFDAIGLPGFQFIQDPIEYDSRTHHSNADVFDRIQADDLKQAATILAAFAYNAAMLDEKLPRKATD